MKTSLFFLDFPDQRSTYKRKMVFNESNHSLSVEAEIFEKRDFSFLSLSLFSPSFEFCVSCSWTISIIMETVFDFSLFRFLLAHFEVFALSELRRGRREGEERTKY
jgi:hypothetical protein